MKKKSFYIIGLLSFSVLFTSCGDSETDKSAEEKVEHTEAKEVEEEKPSLTEEERSTLQTNALKVVKISFKTLAKNVKQAMANGGVQHAAEFCNANAMPLTDSLSKANNVQIARVTDKTRNSNNALNEADQVIWNDFLQQKETTDTIVPTTILQENGEEVITYVPILLNKPLCLNCHGVVGTNIPQVDYDFIHGLYPDDQAVGYVLGDLRGMWKVTQSKN